MKEALSIETERMDDIPLLLTHMQRMKVVELLDKHIPTHGLLLSIFDEPMIRKIGLQFKRTVRKQKKEKKEIVMSDFFLSHIRLYPIKGCAGVDVQEAHMDQRGLRYDRRWMLVNELGLGLQQFNYPCLSRIGVSLDNDGLCVQAPGMSELHIPLQPEHPSPVLVRWYRGSCQALPVSEQADAWFQQFLRLSCRLVFMPENTPRFVEPAYAINHDLAAFTSFPYHLLSEASLQDLNERLDTPVPLERFRPNLIIAGAPAFAEDSWRTFEVNQQTFHVVKPCNRCSITTVDATRGVKTDKEPLTTLARYRTFHQKVLFGQYLISEDQGVLHVGDGMQVLEYQT